MTRDPLEARERYFPKVCDGRLSVGRIRHRISVDLPRVPGEIPPVRHHSFSDRMVLLILGVHCLQEGNMATPFHGANIATDSYSAVVLAKGPVGCWRLDESGGPTAGDASGNGVNGA